MDKSWMEKSRLSKEYDMGVEMFIKFGERHAKGSTFIRCPCLRCGNRQRHSSKDIRDHLYINGIDKSYKTWFWHGEELLNGIKDEVDDNMDESLDEENEDMDNITEAHATNPLMGRCDQNIHNTADIKVDSNKRTTRGPTIMREITRCSSLGERKIVEYNELGQPVGMNGAKLKSYIGSCVHYHVPITYATWNHVPIGMKEKIFKLVQAGFVIDGQSKMSILKVAGNAFRQFKSWLTTRYIIPFKDQPHRLENPPDMYSHIERRHWHQFVKSRLSEEFEKMRTLQVQRRAKKKFNHRTSRKSYADIAYERKKSCSIGKGKAAHKNIKREIENADTEVVSDTEETENTDTGDESPEDVDPTLTTNRSCVDVLPQTLGRLEDSGRVVGMGGLSKPSSGFHITIPGLKQRRLEEKEAEEEENRLLRLRIKELEEQVLRSQFPTMSDHGSCDQQVSDEEVLGPAKNDHFQKGN